MSLRKCLGLGAKVKLYNFKLKRMKKIFMTLMASMLLLSSTTYASEKFGTLNKADSHVLFGQVDVNALALGQSEMMETEGEWAWLIVMLLGWVSNVANAPSTRDRTYRGPIISPSTWW